MALPFQSAGYEDAIGAILEGLQQMQHLDLARAGQLHNLDVGRILQPHRASQISSRIGAVMAAKGNDLWFQVSHPR